MKMKTKPKKTNAKKKAPTAAGLRARKTQWNSGRSLILPDGEVIKEGDEPLSVSWGLPLPSLSELARLAAVLAAAGNRSRLIAPSHLRGRLPADILAWEAMALWSSCGDALAVEQSDRKLENEPDYSDMAMAGMLEFPISFEDGLVSLMGKKVRAADRLRRLEDLLRYSAEKKGKGSMAEAYVKDHIAELKKDGFTEKKFYTAVALLREKKAHSRTERAQLGGKALKEKRDAAKAAEEAKAKQAEEGKKQSGKKT